MLLHADLGVCEEGDGGSEAVGDHNVRERRRLVAAGKEVGVECLVGPLEASAADRVKQVARDERDVMGQLPTTNELERRERVVSARTVRPIRHPNALSFSVHTWSPSSTKQSVPRPAKALLQFQGVQPSGQSAPAGNRIPGPVDWGALGSLVPSGSGPETDEHNWHLAERVRC